MQQAIDKAKRRLPEFWSVLENPGDARNLALKVPFTDGKTTEYFWVIEVSRENETVSGKINNAPEMVSNIKGGQRVTFAASEIADWMFMHAGKMHGNFTLRPLFKTMPPEQVAKFKAILAEP